MDNVINIEILSWEKFNPRKDVKSTSWMRLQNNFCTDPELFEFSNDQKMIWIYILCESSQKYSSKIKVNIGLVAALLKVDIVLVDSTLQQLEIMEIISTSRIRNVSVTDPGPTNERTNERTNEHNSPKAMVFDFELIYKDYPKKLGKTKGISKLKKIIKTGNDFDEFRRAVYHYSKYIRLLEIDDIYVKHFSTFVGCYQDWVNPDKSIFDVKSNKPPFVKILEAIGCGTAKEMKDILGYDFTFLEKMGGYEHLRRLNEYQIKQIYQGVGSA